MPYLLFIDAQVGYLFGGETTETRELDLRDMNLVRDLEVVNETALEAKILSFVTSGKIIPSGILIVLSSAFTFDKNVEDPTNPKQHEEIQAFLSIVPFEEIYSRTYAVGKSSKVIAVNKSFCDAFTTSFEKLKFTLIGIVPFQIVQSLMPEFAEKVDLRAMHGKLDSLKQYSIFTPEKEILKVAENTRKNEPKSKRPVILMGVFAFLIIILGVLVINTFIISHPTTHSTNVSIPPTPTVESTSGQSISSEANSTPSAAPAIGGISPSPIINITP